MITWHDERGKARKVRILALRGNLVQGSPLCSGRLQHEIQEALDEGVLRVVVNIKTIRSIDALGVGELVKARRMIVHSGGVLKIAGVTKKMGNTIKGLRPGHELLLYESEAAAIESFA